MTNNISIDIVLPWVDGSDKKWIQEKNRYSTVPTDEEKQNQTKQFRDWNNLQYVFRGIEKFMPWVRKVHFITYGHKPEWLNVSCEKLNWVHHQDFIPNKYLPTFSSHPIELNIHRIDGLAEHFIYFNDDTFPISPINERFFFSIEGLPKDQSIFFRIPGVCYGDVFGHTQLNDIGVINQNFNRKEVIRRHWSKLFSFKNGYFAPFLSSTFLPTNHFPGFVINHMPQAFLKSTFDIVWSKESEILDSVCQNKFRTVNDINQYLMREWQFVTGRYEPTNIMRHTKYFSIFPKQLSSLQSVIEGQKAKIICINDCEVEDFDYTRLQIVESLNKILPNKSKFEK